MQARSHAHCPLCASDGGRLIWRGAAWRLVHASEEGIGAIYRLILNAHVAEWSQVPAPQRAQAAEVMLIVERALRAHLRPDKINLAALGNQVAHMHWHLIARFVWDSHWPHSIWASAQRAPHTQALQAVEAALPALEADMAAQLLAQKY